MFQIFRGTDAVRRGLLTSEQLRSSAWRQLHQDVYADARITVDHLVQCRAATLCLPAEATLAGPSAAYLLGVRFAAGPQADVHAIVPRTLRGSRRKGLRIHGLPLAPGERRRHRPTGLILTSPLRTAWDVCALPPPEAVAIIDSMLARKLIRRLDLSRLALDRAGLPGSKRAAFAAEVADFGSQSPPESHLRVRLVTAGLPRPVTQHPIRTRGGLLFHPDLAWPEFKVAVEYDGAWHATRDQMSRDHQRRNQLLNEGWIVIHVTSDRLRDDFKGVLLEITTALRSRGWRR